MHSAGDAEFVEPPPFRRNRPLRFMVAWLVLFWLATAIKPFDRFDWLLENLLVFVYSGLLIGSYRRFRFSTRSYLLFTLFMTLHLVGAHYTYTEVPFGAWVRDLFDLQRNHYDRMVHFSYGLLLAYPFYEVLRRMTGVTPGWACFITVNMVLAFSAIFEVIEAWVAMVVSPELGAAYLGIQGDVWDAQRDMFLAVSGAGLAMWVVWTRVRH